MGSGSGAMRRDGSAEAIAVSFAPLVGRESEVHLLTSALRQLGSRSGRLVLITGSPGSGKTRLCHELSTLARHVGGRVAWTRPQRDGDVPLGCWRRAMRRLELHEAPLSPTAPRSEREAVSADGDLTPSYLIDSTVEWILRGVADHPSIVVLDDLHRADRLTVDVLDQLLDELPTRPLLIVATVATAEPGTLPPTITAFPHHPATTRLDLGPLATDDVRRLVTHRMSSPTEAVGRAVDDRAIDDARSTTARSTTARSMTSWPPPRGTRCSH